MALPPYPSATAMALPPIHPRQPSWCSGQRTLSQPQIVVGPGPTAIPNDGASLFGTQRMPGPFFSCRAVPCLPGCSEVLFAYRGDRVTRGRPDSVARSAGRQRGALWSAKRTGTVGWACLHRACLSPCLGSRQGFLRRFARGTTRPAALRERRSEARGCQAATRSPRPTPHCARVWTALASGPRARSRPRAWPRPRLCSLA